MMPDNLKTWTKRNVTDIDKVKEVSELYISMGYEVRVEDFNAKECSDECNTCMLETPEKFKIIYTRKNDDFDDELF